MAEKVGGNLPDMERMAQVFSQQAQSIRDVEKKLQGEASKIPGSWSGANARRFQNSWNQFKSSFNKMATELDEANKGIKKNKQAIEGATGGQ